ncbi:hypothetical protein B0T17DRAFT_617819 [Bombardia bombarda]|uniref:Uncharacterized protein n=1 Tax=Bombardia bombarda TaxID=252184 RepID=A0AA40C0Z7_9PEZI|nr:hypothetical protein B0T17DRAFT_617819 [Bombardia bombarda]
MPVTPPASSKTVDAKWTPKTPDAKWNSKSPAATASPEKDLSSVLRRVKVLAREPSSGAIERLLEVDVGGNAPRSVPRVRVSSPPPWLKNPSTKAGSIEGRLRRVTSGGNPRHPLSQQHRPEVEDFRRRNPIAKSPAAKNLHQTQDTHSGSRAGGEQASPRRSPRRASPHGTTGSLSPRGATTVPTGTNETNESMMYPTPVNIPAAVAVNHRHLLWEMQHADQVEHHTEAKVARRSRGSLPPSPKKSSEGIRESESASTRIAGGGRRRTDEEEDDDVGIRGLTIVLHLRGKDDLVISTDLTRDATETL